MDIYIDSVRGSDANDGRSPEMAISSLDRLNRIPLRGGTRVLFCAGGVWNGSLQPMGNGDENAPIRISRYGSGPAPILNGNGTDSTVLLSDINHIIVEKLEITNISADMTNPHRGVYLRYGITAGGRYRDIHLQELYIHDVRGRVQREAGGIVVWADQSNAPVTFENLSIDNCTVCDADAQGITFSSVYSYRTGINWTDLPYAASANIRICGNYIARCGGDGIFQSCADEPLLEHNTVSSCCFAGNTAYAGIWPHNSQRAIVRGNEAFGNRLIFGDGQGYDVDINCTETLVEHNYSHHNDGGFILLCTSGNIGGFNNGITVRDNVSEEDSGQIFTISGPIRDICLEHNRVSVRKNRGTRLIGLYQWGDSGGGPDNVTVADNDFYLDTEGKNQFYPDTQMHFSGNRCGGSYAYGPIQQKDGCADTRPVK